MSGRGKGIRAAAQADRGLTLIEMMVVLVVISLLAAMGVQSVIAALEMSRERHTEVEILAMVEVVKVYKSDTEACVPGNDENDFKDWLIENKFFEQVELIDGWGREYHIQIHCGTGPGSEYLIWTSDGVDGLRGNDDDIAYLFAPNGWDGWTGQGAFN
jgi:prepilin-type N-terminal cleavage/methylation domain-containing protein